MTMPLLAFDAVSKRHWRGRRAVTVLNDGSLELSAGELGAVWGGRGTGKTTLVELAAGLQAPDAGRILFDGRDVAQLSRRAVSELLHVQVGIATRTGPVSHTLAARDWVAMPVMDRLAAREATRRAQLALERVGAQDVGAEPWRNLSDGERTLVAIARAMVRAPRLLLVDDPSTGLGLLERGEVVALLRSIAEQAGVAVLMTASDLTEVSGADAIWSLAGGRLTGRRAEAGTVVPFPGAAAHGHG
ncbi:MAG: ATP-binding cassette domain-containing protein [Baekduia sp.]